MLNQHSLRSDFFMRILILDTIHGGLVLGSALSRYGHTIEYVDVYRSDLSHKGSVTQTEAAKKEYDLVIHPVHLNPSYPLLRTLTCPSITHHEAVRWILGKKETNNPVSRKIIVEITGARGKTTTATALAFILGDSGVLHTSRGIFRYPEEKFITRTSITPASLLQAYDQCTGTGWMIGEVSLGFTGISDLAILTSDEDYQVAGGFKSALAIKKESALRCRQLLVPPGVSACHDAEISAGDLVKISGSCCRYSCDELEGEFNNPLFILDGYRVPLGLAAAAALILGRKPDRLQDFVAIPGRLEILREGKGVMIDNANSGACLKTTREAVDILREIHPDMPFSLVIGQEHRAVCENFCTEDIISAICEENPSKVFLISGDERIDADAVTCCCRDREIPIMVTETLQTGIAAARKDDDFCFVVSVKTWR
jgi:hypothetical protein